MFTQNPISAVPELFVNIKLIIYGNNTVQMSRYYFQNYTYIIVYTKESDPGRVSPKIALILPIEKQCDYFNVHHNRTDLRQHDPFL